MKNRSSPLWEGACAYAVRAGSTYEIVVFSSNHVRHVVAGTSESADRAEIVTRRLNAYPDRTRRAYGLL